MIKKSWSSFLKDLRRDTGPLARFAFRHDITNGTRMRCIHAGNGELLGAVPLDWTPDDLTAAIRQGRE